MDDDFFDEPTPQQQDSQPSYQNNEPQVEEDEFDFGSILKDIQIHSSRTIIKVFKIMTVLQ